MRALKHFVLIGYLGLAGCVTTAPRSSAQIESDRINTFATILEEGVKVNDPLRVGDAAEHLLDDQKGAARLTELGAKAPVSKALYARYLDTKISKSEIHSPSRVAALRELIVRSRDVQFLTDAQVDVFRKKLDALIESDDGSIGFTLLDVRQFPVLKSPSRLSVLADRSVAAFAQNSYRSDQLIAVLNYIKEEGPQSADGLRTTSALMKAGVRRSELPVIEREAPFLVNVFKQRLYINARFFFKGGDRLLADDVKAVVQRRTPGLVWVDAEDRNALSITVEKVRHEERVNPERHETVTYAQHQVDLGYALMMMPRNASYIYDIAASGASIDYGYVVTVEGGGSAKYETVVRGTASGEEIRCTNARVQNVFGGTQAATFVANQDMATRCNGGNGKSMARLRADIYDAVVDAIRSAPQVSPLIALD
jgi:hypothetical protein